MPVKLLQYIIPAIASVVFNCQINIAQDNQGMKMRFMFYNVENLFDTYDDPLTEDNEFLPDGLRGWNMTRYSTKLLSLYKVIMAAGEGDVPVIAGLCEVENKKVIEDLLMLTPLKMNNNYNIVHEDSDDPRGIDVCLIYRKDRINLLYYSYLYPSSFNIRNIRTRKVLYTKWLAGDDTLHLFLNHWPSRRGGVVAGEDLRITLAQMVRQKGDSIMSAEGECARIIFAGDFNCLPESNEIAILTYPAGSSSDYINIGKKFFNRNEGTYRFEGIWEMPDQVIVSRSFLSSCEGIHTGAEFFKIFKNEAMLIRDRNYPGFRPFSTYSGYNYQGGFSDHLPVVLDLILPANR